MEVNELKFIEQPDGSFTANQPVNDSTGKLMDIPVEGADPNNPNPIIEKPIVPDPVKPVDQPDNKDATPPTEAYNGFVAWAQTKGIDTSTIGKDITIEDAEKRIADYYLDKAIGDRQEIKAMIVDGINPVDYLQNIKTIDEDLKMKDEDLVFGYRCNNMYQAYIAQGLSDADIAKMYVGKPEDAPTEEDKVDAVISSLVLTGLKDQQNWQELAKPIRDQMLADRTKMLQSITKPVDVEADMAKHNQQIEAVATAFKDKIETATKTGLTTFSPGQAGVTEKEELVQFYKSQFMVQKTQDGKTVIPFYQKLQDPDTMLQLMHFLMLKEKGVLTDIKNFTAQQQVNNLSVFPILDGSGKQKTTGPKVGKHDDIPD